MFRKVLGIALLIAILSSCSSEVSTTKDENFEKSIEITNQISDTNDLLILRGFSDSPEFSGLTEIQMSCVVDQLLNFFTPEQVNGLIDEGPNGEQKDVALSALEVCDLLVTLANSGIVEGVVDSFGTFPNDTDCVLSTVRENELFPIFEVLISDIELVEMSEKIENLLVESRILDFLVACVLDAEFEHYQNKDPVCNGLFDRVAKMMTAIVRKSIQLDKGPSVNPELLVELFSYSDEIFIWLSENIEGSIAIDAAVVRDASLYVSKLIIDSFESLEVDATPEDVLEAMFIVVIRMEAELADERASIDQSQKRLEQYLISTCGDSATFLFGLLSGMGQKI